MCHIFIISCKETFYFKSEDQEDQGYFLPTLRKCGENKLKSSSEFRHDAGMPIWNCDSAKLKLKNCS